MKIDIKNLLYRIETWIIIFFILRLFGILDPPLEIGHNWRQALTNMISRNFVENGLDIFHPTIDMAGDRSGIIGSEFPFFNFLVYLISEIFGYAHWYGRLINLIVSSFGIYYFYRLISELLSKKIAFNATIVFLVSIWFSYSRKIMPDTFSVSLVIISLYWAYRYLVQGKYKFLTAYFLFVTLGGLCKIPAISLLGVLIIVPFLKQIDFKRKVWLFSASAVASAIVSFWYFYWVPYLVETYHYQLYFPKTLLNGIHEIIPLLSGLLEKFYFSALESYIAFICFLAGIIVIIKSKLTYLKIALLSVAVIFSIFIIKTGVVFPTHSYYIIPFVPLMALVAGIFLGKIPFRYSVLILVFIVVEAVANQQHDFFIKDSEKYKLELSDIADSISKKDDLIVINGNGNPQLMYFAHRKGWNCDDKQLSDTSFLDEIAGKGCKYIFVDKRSANPKINRRIVYENTNVKVLELIK